MEVISLLSRLILTSVSKPIGDELELTLSLPSTLTRATEGVCLDSGKLVIVTKALVEDGACKFETDFNTSSTYTKIVIDGEIVNDSIDLDISLVKPGGGKVKGKLNGKLHKELEPFYGEYGTDLIRLRVIIDENDKNHSKGHYYDQKLIIRESDRFDQVQIVLKDFRVGYKKEDIVITHKVLLDTKQIL